MVLATQWQAVSPVYVRGRRRNQRRRPSRRPVAELIETNPSRQPVELLSHGQTILDRVLFIALCEDHGLLSDHSLRDAFEHENPYSDARTWANLRGLFRAVDRGKAKLNVPAYNGGLFAAIPELDYPYSVDALALPDAACEKF